MAVRTINSRDWWHHMMDQTSDAPKVAFVINLAQADSSSPNLARLRHLMHLFHGHRVAASWAVTNVSQARVLRDSSPGTSAADFALMVDDNWGASDVSSSRFGNELGSRLVGLKNSVGAAPMLVVGDLGALRSRMTLLADQGVRAIISNDHSASDASSSRPLPCGLWQLVPSLHWPKRRLSRWLPSRSTSVKDLLAADTRGSILVNVEAAALERVSARGLRSIEKLLREVSWSASRGQMQISAVSEIVADLVSEREVKPQRSILRTAA